MNYKARRNGIGRFCLRSVRCLAHCTGVCAISLPLLAGPIAGPGVVTTIHELKNLSADQSLNHFPFRISGTVVCYDSGWNQFYVYDGQETGYFNPNDFKVPLAKGQFVVITGEATGTNEFRNLKLEVAGTRNLPVAKPLEMTGLANDWCQWISIKGWVRSAETTRGRLALVLQERQQNCLVYVMGSPGTNDYQRLLGCRVRLSGINASKATGARLDSPLVFASGWDEIEVLEKQNTRAEPIPVVYIGSLLNRELGSWTNDPVHINGLVVSYEPGQSLLVKDPTGVIRAQVIQLSQLESDERVDIWGFLEVSRSETLLRNAYFQVARPTLKTASEPPVVAADVPNGAQLSMPLTHVADILKLKREQAARHLPVRLSGIVTYADPDWHNGFLQEKGDAIYFELEQRDVRAGQWVEVSGATSAGGFAPEVTNASVKIIAMTNFPIPAKVDLRDLANGHFDAHWVQMEGVVRRADAQWDHLTLTLMTPDGRFKVIIPGHADKPAPENLMDALCSVEGACTSEPNERWQISGVTLHAPTLDFIKVLESPPADPFSVPATPIAVVGTFDPDHPGRRIKIAGTVTLKVPGQGFILQDASGGMRVFTRHGTEPRVGDALDVLGFPVIGDVSPFLEEADFRVTGSGALPAAKIKTAQEVLLQGTNDAQIVEITARLLEDVPRSANPQLVLQDGPIIFTAHIENQGQRLEVPELQSGSLLRLTGVCLIQGGEAHEPVTFRLLLREPRDIKLLEAPPWWTPRHTLAVGGGMMLTIAAAMGWIVSLRKRVQKQTELVRQKLEREAALEERYRDLFENANDMVYTHDLAGHITSINQAGERLLQCPREQILRRTVLDLIAEDQREAAREWLNDVLRGIEPPATELDLITGGGQRVRMEISARLIQRGGELVEVEGIARDITERKRLEREILEISNREQRRIGHDLHDGVCQQLAGISYMTASLAHLLQEKGIAESAKAERIGTLLNAVMNQTRGVARGLFPVRLEENGLVSALEELAANASELFKINCRFVSDQPPSAVDNGIALHLYYIVLEAVANASKHGKAGHVAITLEPSGERYMLSVKDDGIGLPATGRQHTGMGIRIMHYRARVIGATLTLQRGPAGGTQVTCLFLPASRDVAPEQKPVNRLSETMRV